MIWKLRYFVDIARNCGVFPLEKLSFYWESAVASYDAYREMGVDMTPEEAVSEDIAAWYS